MGSILAGRITKSREKSSPGKVRVPAYAPSTIFVIIAVAWGWAERMRRKIKSVRRILNFRPYMGGLY